MANLVLAPHASAARLQSEIAETPVPGWPGSSIPNFSRWRSGDIVLVRRDRGLAGLLLSGGQYFSRSAASRNNREWTHAGLYVGGGEIVEAIFGDGIVKSSIWKYCQYRAICVRRIRAPFTGADGAVAAKAALGYVGQPYAWQEVALSKLIPARESQPGRLYCSTFVGIAINASTGYSLYGDSEHLPLQPATLAAHPGLADVRVQWRRM